MACSKEISEELEKCKIFEVFEEKCEFVFEGKKKLYADELEKCLDSFQLDDKETNIDKIASATHNFLLISSIKDAKQIIEECQADGKTNYASEQKNKKIGEMTAIFYDEKLKMLKQHLFIEE